jgi:3-oxoacyl-[acyl-carrier-protein] synthase II
LGRRVVVTGTGLAIPQGLNVAEAWKNIREGVSGIGPITRFDASDLPVRIAGEITNFHPEDHFDKRSARHLDPFTQLGIVAARMALAESGLVISDANRDRIGVITGTGIGGLPTISEQHSRGLSKGFSRISPFFVTLAIPNMPAGQISIYLGIEGPNLSFTTACAAGTHAVGEAYRHVKYGMIDAVITGGAESTICALGLGGFSAMKALSNRNDDPRAASRPFDRDRDGFVMAEGAGMLVLEEYEHARKRGAQIIAEVAGYGLSSDAHHIAAPLESGAGAARAMRLAIEDAGLGPQDVHYVNAHGTSTPLNDRCETRAIKTVFGEGANRVAVSSTKSMTGHMLGATGGVEAVFIALSIRDQVAPPTINLDNLDPECDLDYVPNAARDMKIDVALSNSFGFGGTNAVVAMKRFEG